MALAAPGLQNRVKATGRVKSTPRTWRAVLSRWLRGCNVASMNWCITSLRHQPRRLRPATAMGTTWDPHAMGTTRKPHAMGTTCYVNHMGTTCHSLKLCPTRPSPCSLITFPMCRQPSPRPGGHKEPSSWPDNPMAGLDSLPAKEGVQCQSMQCRQTHKCIWVEELTSVKSPSGVEDRLEKMDW